jgi:hypothetical protein
VKPASLMPALSYGTTFPSLITHRQQIISGIGEYFIDPGSTCIAIEPAVVLRWCRWRLQLVDGLTANSKLVTTMVAQPFKRLNPARTPYVRGQECAEPGERRTPPNSAKALHRSCSIDASGTWMPCWPNSELPGRMRTTESRPSIMAGSAG